MAIGKSEKTYLRNILLKAATAGSHLVPKTELLYCSGFEKMCPELINIIQNLWNGLIIPQTKLGELLIQELANSNILLSTPVKYHCIEE